MNKLIRDAERLDPAIRDKYKLFLQKCRDTAFPVMINETLRLPGVQAAYALQGRGIPLDLVNAVRRSQGLWDISHADNQISVTWTLDSKHIRGLAFDVVPLNKAGNPWWNAPTEVWEKMGKLGESCGLEWGGRWPSPKTDRPHFQVTP